MRIFFIILAVTHLTVPSFAQEAPFNPKVISTSNDVLLNIYNDIIAAKDRYPVLANFGDTYLSRNSYGIYEIEYQAKELEGIHKGKPYAFGVTIVGMDDPNVWRDGAIFNVGFPLLNVRFTGFQKRENQYQQFDLHDSVQRYGELLWDSQQEYIPYQLSLKPMKEQFSTNENIQFTVSLTNTTIKNIKVRRLDADSLYFLYDNKAWGAKEVEAKSSADTEIILKPGEATSRIFQGQGFPAKSEINIYCSYIQTYQGVKPSAILTVEIIDEVID